VIQSKEHWGEFDTPELVRLRQRMIESQLVTRSIRDKRVLEAMSVVPRHLFVEERLSDRAYDDCPQSIGHGQTISQPFIVADMTQQLELKESDHVLEIGTGCGYQTAVLAMIVNHVTSIERIPELSAMAASILAQLEIENITLRVGDGRLGWVEAAPYDAIIVTAAADREPEQLFEQLAPNGRIVYPFGRRYGLTQDMVKCRKTETGLERQVLYAVRFVPLK